MVELAQALRGKVRRRLVAPFIFLMFMASLDRVNVSFAALRMNADLHFSPSEYGLGASVFFIGFLLGQYPSVLLLERIGIKAWLATVLTAWGVAAAALAFVHSAPMFIALRIILGFAEAGLTPGIVLYLGGWSPTRDRASTFALPMLAIPLSIVLGGPFSGWLLSIGSLPLASWRWMFLAEGAPILVLAVVAFFYFPREPRSARWLTTAEQDWIIEHRAIAKPAAEADSGVRQILGDGKVWGTAAMWFLLLSGSYAITFWLPQVVKQISHIGDVQVGLISALPWIGNGLGVALAAMSSDRTQERFWHFGVAALTAAVAFALIGPSGSPALGLLLLIIGATGMGAAQGVFWAIPTAMFPPRGMAAGVTLVNMAGCSAGFVIPWLVGVIRQASGSFGGPIYLVASFMALSFGVLCILRPGSAGHETTAAIQPETP